MRIAWPMLLFGLILTGTLLTPATVGKACQRAKPFSLRELRNADAVIRVTALKYAVAAPPNTYTKRGPAASIEFKLEETLKGSGLPPTLVLPGFLSKKDDFNDHPVPYTFVRPEGRHGSCYAFTYKQGAQFLLFLKKRKSGYTPYWNPLAPTNEQIRSAHDPWVRWTKGFLAATGSTAREPNQRPPNKSLHRTR